MNIRNASTAAGLAAIVGAAALLTGCTGSAPVHPSHTAVASAPTSAAATPVPTSQASGVLDAYWFSATSQLPQGADPKSDGWQSSALAPQNPNGTGEERSGSVRYTYAGGQADIQIYGPDATLTGASVVDNMTAALAAHPLTITVAPLSIAVPGGLPAEFAQGTDPGNAPMSTIAMVIMQDPQGNFYRALLQSDPDVESAVFPVFQQVVQSVTFEGK
ncbi:MAG: hypothetical protein ABI310_05755 [Microbacteriaceae bacterium]